MIISVFEGETKQTNIPAYYFTKPLTRQTHQALGGISGVLTTNSPQKSSMAGKETVEIEGKTYYKVWKSVAVKRSGTASRSRSPWCKPSRRPRRRMLFYVDTAGHEYPASHFDGHSEAENEGENAAENDATEPSPDASQNEYVELNGKRYRKVVRRKRMKRAGSSSSKSPWCKSSKPRFQNVVFLVDDEGNEIEESKLGNENGDSDAGSEASQPRSINSPLKVDVNPRSHSPHGSRAPSMSPTSRSVRSHSAHSPRILSPDKTPQKSPRAKSRSKSRSRSRSRSQSQERERSKTPQRMVNGGSPACAKVSFDSIGIAHSQVTFIASFARPILFL
jgi:hypothetical protein